MMDIHGIVSFLVSLTCFNHEVLVVSPDAPRQTTGEAIPRPHTRKHFSLEFLPQIYLFSLFASQVKITCKHQVDH